MVVIFFLIRQNPILSSNWIASLLTVLSRKYVAKIKSGVFWALSYLAFIDNRSSPVAIVLQPSYITQYASQRIDPLETISIFTKISLFQYKTNYREMGRLCCAKKERSISEMSIGITTSLSNISQDIWRWGMEKLVHAFPKEIMAKWTYTDRANIWSRFVDFVFVLISVPPFIPSHPVLM